MPPLLSRRGLGIPQSFPFSPEAPLGRGAVERSETERLFFEGNRKGGFRA
nr:MAG TPA: hypothetical protein [Caudoviricetes sp.]